MREFGRISERKLLQIALKRALLLRLKRRCPPTGLLPTSKHTVSYLFYADDLVFRRETGVEATTGESVGRARESVQIDRVLDDCYNRWPYPLHSSSASSSTCISSPVSSPKCCPVIDTPRSFDTERNTQSHRSTSTATRQRSLHRPFQRQFQPTGRRPDNSHALIFCKRPSIPVVGQQATVLCVRQSERLGLAGIEMTTNNCLSIVTVSEIVATRISLSSVSSAD